MRFGREHLYNLLYVVKCFLGEFTASKPYPSSLWPSFPEREIFGHQVTGSEEGDNSVLGNASDGKSVKKRMRKITAYYGVSRNGTRCSLALAPIAVASPANDINKSILYWPFELSQDRREISVHRSLSRGVVGVILLEEKRFYEENRPVFPYNRHVCIKIFLGMNNVTAFKKYVKRQAGLANILLWS